MTIGSRPARNEARNVAADDRLPEDVPSSSLRIVPLGDFHIFFRPNSATRASSGVIVAHFTPTLYSLIARAASSVTWSSVASRCWIRQIVVFQVDLEVRQDQLLFDELPNDAGHLVAVEFDDRVADGDLLHKRRVSLRSCANPPKLR